MLAQDQVFKQSYIPRRLEEVINLDKEVARVNSGGADTLEYQSVAGVVPAK